MSALFVKFLFSENHQKPAFFPVNVIDLPTLMQQVFVKWFKFNSSHLKPICTRLILSDPIGLDWQSIWFCYFKSIKLTALDHLPLSTLQKKLHLLHPILPFSRSNGTLMWPHSHPATIHSLPTFDILVLSSLKGHLHFTSLAPVKQM